MGAELSRAGGWTDGHRGRHFKANTRFSKFFERPYKLNTEITTDLEPKANSYISILNKSVCTSSTTNL